MANKNNPLAKNSPALNVKEFQDAYLRENFKNLQEYFAQENQLLGFKFFDLTFTKAQANIKQAHGLKIAPQDILVTKVTGSGIVQFNHGLFDATYIDITVTGAVRVRFYVGTYWDSVSASGGNKTDYTQYTANGSTLPSGVTVEANKPVISSSGVGVIGDLKPWPGTSLYMGAVWADGALYSAEAYPAAAKVLWDPVTERYAFGGTGVWPKGSFNVPDVRGKDLRGVDGTAGLDPDKDIRVASNPGGNEGNNVGSYQDDAMQNLTGSFAFTDNDTTSMAVRVRQADGAFGITSANLSFINSNAIPAAVTAGYKVDLNASTTNRTSTENRGKNLNVNWIFILS